jgi:hypothetical protein
VARQFKTIKRLCHQQIKEQQNQHVSHMTLSDYISAGCPFERKALPVAHCSSAGVINLDTCIEVGIARLSEIPDAAECFPESPEM